MDRQAALVARWQLVGFIHGVMNTDNMAISGETIDYGPCAFMNAYDPGTVFSSIDRAGRYAYGNQPAIAQWNLARFAETLLPLLDPDQEKAVAVAPRRSLDEFPAGSRGTGSPGCGEKLGLQTDEAGDAELVQSLLDWMEKSRADFTNTFRDLSSEEPPAGDRYEDPDFRAWYARWQERLGRDGRPTPRLPRRDADRQPGRHPAEPPGRGGALRRRGARRPVGAARAAGGAGVAVRAGTGDRAIPDPSARRVRLPHVLRDVVGHNSNS